MTNKYRVEVWHTRSIIGWIEVDAQDECAARQAVFDMDSDDIEYLAEWGSCGDESNIEVGEEVEDITPASVSDGLWN